MKTKLLKKVRKIFAIYLHPHKTENPYTVFGDYCRDGSWMHLGFEEHKDTKQECLDRILREVRSGFYKHTRKYKMSQVTNKVWYK